MFNEEHDEKIIQKLDELIGTAEKLRNEELKQELTELCQLLHEYFESIKPLLNAMSNTLAFSASLVQPQQKTWDVTWINE